MFKKLALGIGLLLVSTSLTGCSYTESWWNSTKSYFSSEDEKSEEASMNQNSDNASYTPYSAEASSNQEKRLRDYIKHHSQMRRGSNDPMFSSKTTVQGKGEIVETTCMEIRYASEADRLQTLGHMKPGHGHVVKHHNRHHEAKPVHTLEAAPKKPAKAKPAKKHRVEKKEPVAPKMEAKPTTEMNSEAQKIQSNTLPVKPETPVMAPPPVQSSAPVPAAPAVPAAPKMPEAPKAPEAPVKTSAVAAPVKVAQNAVPAPQNTAPAPAPVGTVPPAPPAMTPPPPPPAPGAVPPAPPAAAPAPEMPKLPDASKPASTPAQTSAAPSVVVPASGGESGNAVMVGRISTLSYTDSELDISSSNQSTLDTIADDLKSSDKNVKIQSYGYASDGNASEARRNSLQRAIKVRKYLIEKGVNASRISVNAIEDMNNKSNKVEISFEEIKS